MRMLMFKQTKNVTIYMSLLFILDVFKIYDIYGIENK